MKEEDLSYAKGSLGTKLDNADGRHKTVGVQWDFMQDTFTFNIRDVLLHGGFRAHKEKCGMTAQFFNPLGVVYQLPSCSRCSFNACVKQ